MKLLFCPKCYDVFKLAFGWRSCECGEVSGRYVNDIEAEVNGKGVSLAIGNGSLFDAVVRFRRMGGDYKKDARPRPFFIEKGSVICWVRPHEGPGNPHTKVVRKRAAGTSNDAIIKRFLRHARALGW